MKWYLLKNKTAENVGARIELSTGGGGIDYKGNDGAVSVTDDTANICLAPNEVVIAEPTNFKTECFELSDENLYAIEIGGVVVPHAFEPAQLPAYFNNLGNHKIRFGLCDDTVTGDMVRFNNVNLDNNKVAGYIFGETEDTPVIYHLNDLTVDTTKNLMAGVTFARFSYNYIFSKNFDTILIHSRENIADQIRVFTAEGDQYVNRTVTGLPMDHELEFRNFSDDGSRFIAWIASHLNLSSSEIYVVQKQPDGSFAKTHTLIAPLDVAGASISPDGNLIAINKALQVCVLDLDNTILDQTTHVDFESVYNQECEWIDNDKIIHTTEYVKKGATGSTYLNRIWSLNDGLRKIYHNESVSRVFDTALINSKSRSPFIYGYTEGYNDAVRKFNVDTEELEPINTNIDFDTSLLQDIDGVCYLLYSEEPLKLADTLQLFRDPLEGGN